MKKNHLMGTSALSVPAVCALAVMGGAAWAQNTPCVVGSTVVTCSGNQLTGVRDGQNGVTATKDLVVNNLSTDIGPIDYGTGYEGILHFANSNSNIDHITVTADLDPYKISAYASGIKLGFSESAGAGAVELSQSGKIQVYGPNNHGIHATVTGAEGKPAGAFQIGVAGSIVTDADTSTSAVGLLVEGIGGDGGTGKAGGAGPNFNGPDALTTTGGMTILSNGAGVGSDGTSTAGAHGVYVLGQGGDGGDGEDEGGFATGGAGGAGGNAAGTAGAWTIGGADAGAWDITTQGDYSNAFRIVGEGGAGGKGGHADGLYDGGNGGAGGSGTGMFLFYADPTPPQVLGTTHGDYAPAFHFVSQGGQGGNGGGGYGGGSGAKGGDAGDIYLGEDGRQMYPTTYGDTSHGFYIHSQGGDGGNGIAGAEGDGGDGGDGGAGGLIQTFLFFESATSGAHSPGFAAYSTGGGGGENGKGGFLSTSGSDPATPPRAAT